MKIIEKNLKKIENCLFIKRKNNVYNSNSIFECFNIYKIIKCNFEVNIFESVKFFNKTHKFAVIDKSKNDFKTRSYFQNTINSLNVNFYLMKSLIINIITSIVFVKSSFYLIKVVEINNSKRFFKIYFYSFNLHNKVYILINYLI